MCLTLNVKLFTKIQLQCDQSLLDIFKAEILSDPSHNILLLSLDGLPPAPTSVRYQDLLIILNSRRNASSPGINMIPYRVYKKCPRITSFLFKIFKSCLKLSNVPIQWRIASEVYIPKFQTRSLAILQPLKISDQ